MKDPTLVLKVNTTRLPSRSGAVATAEYARSVRAALLATVLAISCNTFAPGPAPGGSPTVTPFVEPTRSRAPAASPTAFTGHYGFLVETAAGCVLSREGETATIATIPLTALAVSPDGRHAAGFTTAQPYELRTFDLASPATTSAVATLAAGERGSGVAWSSDGSGLAFTVARADEGVLGNPIWSALRTVDLSTRTPKEAVRLDGIGLLPLIWDRLGGDLVAAVATQGDAATEYVVVRGVQPPARKTLPEGRWHATVSGDQRWIVIAASDRSVYRTFQADDPSFIVETHGLTDAAVSALGRPMNGDIGVVLDSQLILWDPATGLRRQVPVAEAVTGIVGFRFDGSAVLVRTASGVHLIDLASNRDTPVVTGNVVLGVALP